MNKNKNILSLAAIVLSVIAIGLSIYTTIALQSYKAQPLNSQSEAQNAHTTPHYSCIKCNYSFNDLSPLRVESHSGNHYYFCPSCGELLTSDYKYNALENLFTLYHVVKDNWN